MEKRDKRVDEYINKSAEFAKPILIHLRKLIHQANPQIKETIKWGFPHFDYNGNLCHMASFKQHCAFGFWKAALMSDSNKLLTVAKSEIAMGHFGKITSLKDLPKDSIIISYVKEAVRLNQEKIKVPKKVAKEQIKLKLHPEFELALTKNKKAMKTYEGFSYSNKKEYVNWINEAKTDTTLTRRIQDAINWLSEGKIRNWKYVKK